MARTPTTRGRRNFVTPEGVDLGLDIADAGERAGAFLIDAAIIVGVLVAFSIVVGVAMAAGGFQSGELMAVIWLLGFFLLRNFYFAGFELTAHAATPGKRILGLRVASRDGGRLRPEAVFVRNALRELEVFLPLSVLAAQAQTDGAGPLTYLLSLVWVCIFVFFPLFNRDNLRVGDLVGGTWVVRAARRKLSVDLAEAGAEGLVRYGFTPDQLDAYGEKELLVLEDVLRARDRRTLRQVAQRIAEKIGYDRTPGVTDEAFLAAYYAGLRGRLEQRMLLGRRRADKHAA